MDANFFLKGVVFGLSIAAPVGPIGVLCIRRTLAEGRAVGLATGLGVATADAAYGCVAAFGLTLIPSFLLNQQGWLRFIGGGFLCYLGIRTFLAPVLSPTPVEIPDSDKRSIQSKAIPSLSARLFSAYSSAVLLTLTNPLTILSFTVVFAGLGVGTTSGDYLSAGVTVLGVFLGSALWWLILSGGVGLFRLHISPSRLQWVNRISGIIITVFGSMALLSLVQMA